MQGPPSGPDIPSEHMQFVEVLDPLKEIEPKGHVLHGYDPMVALYLPASHSSQCSPLLPLLHVQFANEVLASSEVEPVEQCKQAVLPMSVEYFPGAHFWQPDDATSAYIPALQTTSVQDTHANCDTIKLAFRM